MHSRRILKIFSRMPILQLCVVVIRELAIKCSITKCVIKIQEFKDINKPASKPSSKVRIWKAKETPTSNRTKPKSKALAPASQNVKTIPSSHDAKKLRCKPRRSSSKTLQTWFKTNSSNKANNKSIRASTIQMVTSKFILKLSTAIIAERSCLAP